RGPRNRKMTSRHSRTTETGGTHRRSRKGAAEDSAARPGGDEAAEQVSSCWSGPSPGRHAAAGSYTAADPHANPGPRADQNMPGDADRATVPSEGLPGWPPGAEPADRRTATGWMGGDEEGSDLTSR